MALVALLLVGLLLTGGAYALFTQTSSAKADTASASDIEEGKKLFAANCATCHAIAQFDESTLATAPPFRIIGARTSRARLREMLGGRVFLDHAVMPDFEPDSEQADDLANYIASIASGR